MLSVSILMYRAEGCAVPRRAELRRATPRSCSIQRCGSCLLCVRVPTETIWILSSSCLRT
eukprot:2254269-Pyramimonas_sp.AAC.1